MPELYDVDSERALEPGDVVMVARKMRDKATRRLYDWKFFMVLTERVIFSDSVKGFVVGATNLRLKDHAFRIAINEKRNVVHYLPPDEWPDGVQAFRMGMILKGLIEDI